MASPHVAGAAALYLQTHPTATPSEVASALVASSTANAIFQLAPGTPNKLLRVNGPSTGDVLSPPTNAPAPTNAAPTASFTIGCPSSKGYCSFDGSASKDDSRIVSYSWSFGDGTSSVTASSPVTTHNYSAKGTYSVTLIVLDDGGLSSTVRKSVTVKSVPRR